MVFNPITQALLNQYCINIYSLTLAAAICHSNCIYQKNCSHKSTTMSKSYQNPGDYIKSKPVYLQHLYLLNNATANIEENRNNIFLTSNYNVQQSALTVYKKTVHILSTKTKRSTLQQLHPLISRTTISKDIPYNTLKQLQQVLRQHRHCIYLSNWRQNSTSAPQRQIYHSNQTKLVLGKTLMITLDD
jgi:hypothetical protein